MAAPEVEDRLGDAEQETILLELHRYGEPLVIPVPRLTQSITSRRLTP